MGKERHPVLVTFFLEFTLDLPGVLVQTGGWRHGVMQASFAAAI